MNHKIKAMYPVSSYGIWTLNPFQGSFSPQGTGLKQNFLLLCCVVSLVSRLFWGVQKVGAEGHGGQTDLIGFYDIPFYASLSEIKA